LRCKRAFGGLTFLPPQNGQVGSTSADIPARVEFGAEVFDWYHNWRAKRGRPLRVLHLGNIANNAFNNARIQRQYGIDAYVIAYENYHIMACPEWEEATFEGDLGDPFFPNWKNLDLAGYQRPRWFTSGPLHLCCRVIEAEVSGMSDRADQLRLELKTVREAECLQTYRAFLIRQARRVRRRLARLSGELREIAGVALNAVFLRPQKSDPDHSRVIEIWKKARASHQSVPNARDFSGYRARLRDLKALFQYFDVIQAYSTDGAWPLLAEQPYVAYEHGTLRAIPFVNDLTGRLAATVFLGADHVFVTNLDCMEAGERLGIPAHRFSPLPHAFDEKRLVGFRHSNREIRPPDDRVIFFHPARQDWRVADPSMIKGNDRLVRAFARISRMHSSARLVMIAWGRDLDATRDLIKSLGIEGKVQWLDPMRKQDLWRAYLSSHAVLDQFVLPSFGGVTFEALALGCRVITNVDFGAAERFFSKAPPVYSASSETDIYEMLERIILDRNDLAGVGDAGAEWIKKYHSAERIVELQLEIYRKFPGVATSELEFASEARV
jgi:glycosyltransferase involved in cell wall biosynthesis